MYRFGRALFKFKETAKKLLKEGFIIVKAFEEGKRMIIYVFVKNVLNE